VTATAVGFFMMGFIGFFVKLIHIPINNIIVYVARLYTPNTPSRLPRYKRLHPVPSVQPGRNQLAPVTPTAAGAAMPLSAAAPRVPAPRPFGAYG